MPELQSTNVFVQFSPSFKGMVRASKRAGQEGGEIFAKAFQQTGDHLKAGFGSLTDDAAREGLKSAEAFNKAFQAKVKASAEKLPVTAGATAASRRLNELRAEMLKLSEQKIGIDIDAETAFAKFATIQNELMNRAKRAGNLQVKTAALEALGVLETLRDDAREVQGVVTEQSKEAQLQVAKLQEKLSTLSNKQIGVEVSTEQATLELNDLSRELNQIARNSAIDMDVRVEAAQALTKIKELKTQIETIENPDVDINARTDEAKAKVEAIRGDISRLATEQAQVEVGADTTVAKLELDSIKRELSSIQRDDSIDIDVRADAARALAELETVNAEIERIDGKNVDVKANTSGLNGLGFAATGAASKVSALVWAAGAVGPAFVAAGAVAVGALAGIAAAATSAAGGLLVGIGALGSIGSKYSEYKQAKQSAASSGGGGVSGASNAAAQASAERQYQRQIADGQKSLAKAQAEAAKSAQDAANKVNKAEADKAKAVQEANRKIEDATKNLSKVQAKGARDIAAADAAVSKARADAARQAQASARAIANAEKRLEKAQTQVLKAQQALTQARAQARRTMDDLARSVKQGALAERSAALSVQEARKRLDELQRSGVGEGLEWEQARLSYEQALQSLDDQVEANRRLAEEKAKADTAGVEGSEEVLAAQEQLANAQEGVADAQQAVADARQQAADQAAAAAERIAEAEERAAQVRLDVAEKIRAAEESLAQAKEDAAERVRAADEKVTEAKQAQAEAAVSAAEKISDAEENLARLREDHAAKTAQFGQSASGAAGGVNQLKDALDGLPPSAVNFIHYLEQMEQKLTPLRDAAYNGLLPRLQTAMQGLEPYLPGVTALVGDLATRMGDLAIKAVEGLGNPVWQKFGDMLSRTMGPNLTSVGNIVGNLATGLAGIATAFEPVAQKFITGLEASSSKFASWGAGLGDNPKFKQFLDYIDRMAPKVKEALAAMGRALLNVIEATGISGGDSLDRITGFFNKVAEISPETLNSIGSAVAKIAGGIAAFSGIATAANAIGSVVGTLKSLGSVLGIGGGAAAAEGAAGAAAGVAGAAGGAVEGAAGVAGAAGGAGGLAGTLGRVVGLVGNFGSKLASLAGPVGIAIGVITSIGAAIASLWQNNEGFRETIMGAWEGIQEGISRIWNEVLQPIFSAFGSIIQTVADIFGNILGPIVEAVWNGILQPIFTLLGTVVSTVFNAIVMPIFKLAAAAFQALATALKWANDKIIGPVFKAVGSVLDFVWSHTIKVVFDAINTAWKAVSDGISTVWNSFMKPIFDFIGEFLKVTFLAAWNAMSAEVKKVWTGIKTMLDSVWKNNIKPIFDPIATFLKETFVGYFTTAKESIKTAWDGLKEIAKTPIKFIVETVWNNGIAKSFNDIAQKLGMSSRLPTYQLNFASGGVLPGYTPGRDVHHFFSPTAGWLNLSGGEGIIRPDALRALGGKKWLDMINRTRGKGLAPTGDFGLAGLGNWSFSKGGIWGGFTSWVSGAASTISRAFSTVTDFVDKVLEDPLGAVTDLILTPAKNLLSGISGGKLGQIVTGVVPWTFNGIKSIFKKDADKVGGPGQHAVTYARKLVAQKVPYVWGGSSIPPGLDCSGLVYYTLNHMVNPKAIARTTAAGYEAASKAVNWSDKRIGDLLFYGPKGNASHIAFYSGNNRLIEEPRPGGHAQEVPVRTGRAGRLLFDEGGWLPPGASDVLNLTGKPEAIMTDSLMREYTAKVMNHTTSGHGMNVSMVINNPLGQPTIDDVNRSLRRVSYLGRRGATVL